MPSASARLQHASLPSFGKAKQGSTWEEESERHHVDQSHDDRSSTATTGQSFEEGVVRVESELNSEMNFEQSDDWYDLLPLPVPAPERRILTVGNAPSTSSAKVDPLFHYGSVADLDLAKFESRGEDSRSAVLGNMVVDENIGKLSEVIRSVDHTLSRCLNSSGGIGKARRERLRVQLEVIRGLDSWAGLRGQFVSQRALLRGVDGMAQSREIYEESDLILIDGKYIFFLSLTRLYDFTHFFRRFDMANFSGTRCRWSRGGRWFRDSCLPNSSQCKSRRRFRRKVCRDRM